MRPGESGTVIPGVMLQTGAAPPYVSPRQARHTVTTFTSECLPSSHLRVKTLKVPNDGEIEAARSDLAEMMVALLHPASRGELTLRSTGPNVQPRLDYNYLSETSDRQSLRHGARQALQLAQREGLRELLGDRLEPADPDLVSDESLDAGCCGRQ